MTKYPKKYIVKKIENCNKLVENATSDAQRTIYQGYLAVWQNKAEYAEDLKKEREDQETAKKVAEEKVKELQEAAARAKAAEDIEKLVNMQEISSAEEMMHAEEFETLNPNKRAYRYKDGEKLQTNTFIEFINLKSETQ